MNKTIIELKKICKEQKIKGYSKKNKQELIELIEQNEPKEKEEKKELIELIEQNEPKEKEEKKELIELIEKNKTKEKEEKENIIEDSYTQELLKEQYYLHKKYVIGRIETTKKIGVKVRLPCIPEDISENIVKQIINNKLNDKTSKWDCKKGDLESKKEGKQECKCFTSDGPLSFTPSSEWDVIYFLDARYWLNDHFILYRVVLRRTSIEWKNIKISKTQTFEDQTKQGRRPRINWESLKPQIQDFCSKIYEGIFEDIFIPL